MSNIEKKVGISIGVLLALLLFLMSFGGEIEALNKGEIITSVGIGEGVFSSMKDFLTYHVFIIGCVLSILYLLLIIGQRIKK